MPVSDRPNTLPYLRVGVVSATDQVARVAAFSASGNAFCLQRTPAGLTYGAGEGSGTTQPRTVGDAIAGCADKTWSAAAVRMFPVATMCDGADRTSYLVCRMVQALVTSILRDAKPV